MKSFISFDFNPRMVIGTLLGLGKQNSTVISDRDFENYQRILSQQATFSAQIMTLLLGFLASGAVAIFTISAIGSNSGSHNNPIFWLKELSWLLFIITGFLWIIWEREHLLKRKVVESLKAAGVQFPKSGCWEGVTGLVWRAIFLFSLGFWIISLFNLYVVPCDIWYLP